MKVIKNISHSSLFIIISVFLHLSAFSDPIISIQTDKNEYAVGDLVCADISISGNQGFHNLYFDLL